MKHFAYIFTINDHGNLTFFSDGIHRLLILLAELCHCCIILHSGNENLEDLMINATLLKTTSVQNFKNLLQRPWLASLKEENMPSSDINFIKSITFVRFSMNNLWSTHCNKCECMVSCSVASINNSKQYM